MSDSDFGEAAQERSEVMNSGSGRQETGKPSKYFYGGIVYTAEDMTPVVDWLLTHADEAPFHHDEMMATILGLMGRGLYPSAVEAFTVLCAVHAAVRTAMGEQVVAPR